MLLDNGADCNKANESTENPDLPKPLFSNKWQFEKTVSSSGGRLQGYDSDVVVSIPPYAVDDAHSLTTSSCPQSSKQDLFNESSEEHEHSLTVKIHGTISTDLRRVHEQLQLEEDEKICSPVAEYFAGKDFRFQKPVCILLPHFLPDDILRTEIRVYQVEAGDGGTVAGISTVQLLKTTHEESKDLDSSDFTCTSAEGFCLKNGQVWIFTTHFSAYFCTHCKKELNPPNLYLRLYASYLLRKSIHKTATDVSLKLFIWDSRLAIRDFRKVSTDLSVVLQLP
jgi:hypothetical protein